jgi:hypothetical protein
MNDTNSFGVAYCSIENQPYTSATQECSIVAMPAGT